MVMYTLLQSSTATEAAYAENGKLAQLLQLMRYCLQFQAPGIYTEEMYNSVSNLCTGNLGKSTLWPFYQQWTYGQFLC